MLLVQLGINSTRNVWKFAKLDSPRRLVQFWQNIQTSLVLSSLYVCMAIKYIIVLFVETPRKFITAKLSIRKPGSSSVLIICDLFNSHALFIYKSVVMWWLASFKI